MAYSASGPVDENAAVHVANYDKGELNSGVYIQISMDINYIETYLAQMCNSNRPVPNLNFHLLTQKVISTEFLPLRRTISPLLYATSEIFSSRVEEAFQLESC